MSARPRWMMKNRRDEYVARSANGSRKHTVVGIAVLAPSRKCFSEVAVPLGTRLIRRGCVQDVVTNGDGLPA